LKDSNSNQFCFQNSIEIEGKKKEPKKGQQPNRASPGQTAQQPA
jgi:hypothetical protein